MVQARSKLALIWLITFLLLAPQILFAAEQDPSIIKAVSYLKTMQNSDGGFTDRQGTPSSERLTHWVIMALSAAGEDVDSGKWTKNGNTPMDFILRNTKFDETTHHARALMALKAAGYRGTVNGVDLEEKILSFQKANGQFSQYDKGERDLINAHVWSVFALTAAGKEIPQKEKAKAWLLAQQNIDGGFGWAVGGDSDPDSTGVAMTALIILGEKTDSPAIKRAVKYLKNQQEEHGGFSSDLNKANSASNAWAIQGLLAVGEDPKNGQWKEKKGNPVSYLKSLQNPQGYFEWTEGRQASPTLMTAYAIMALAEKPFPININLQASSKIVLTVDRKEALIGNTKVNLAVAPKIVGGSTMVPLRFIVEGLGAEIQWVEKTGEVIIRQGKKAINLIPPLLENGTTLVPVRYVSESLGAKVDWYDTEKRIEIAY
jgi:prenyltransferase beta subunit